MILFFINAQESKSSTLNTISNSYNTYNYNTYNDYPTPVYNQIKSTNRDYSDSYKRLSYQKTYPTKNYDYKYNYNQVNDYSYNPSKTYYRKNYDYYDKYEKNLYIRSTSTGYRERYSGVFGNEINEYKVYVRNREYKGGYFTVKFYLTDYYGKTRAESMTHYLRPHEERKFVYKNVFNDGKEYKYWGYKVISHTRI